MQKIIPFIWFNTNAKEAVEFYTSIFENSKIGNMSMYDEESSKVSGMNKGDILTISFHLEGQEFAAINGGPEFSLTPAISFFVNCNSEEEVNRIWEKLSPGGIALMELGKYPFSDRYGWIQDKYGVSWQISLGSSKQKITPFLMFVGDKYGKAKEAIQYYTSIFKNSNIENTSTEGYSIFSLEGYDFMVSESDLDHKFTFSHAISFLVNCESQEEVDYFWDTMTKDGKPEPCGWLLDRYGVSWQIVPTILDEMLNDKDPIKAKRVMSAMLKMEKIEIQKLKDAYGGV
jgi:predicted 3-demethylubiquinone-9 3-methyltransferase (glyoxalase superfamily)